MMTTSRRRFAPSLDRLPSRVVLSGGDAVVTPMDLVLLTPDAPPACEVVVTPMDPIVLGPSCDAPAWSIPAGAMGDTLALSPDVAPPWSAVASTWYVGDPSSVAAVPVSMSPSVGN